MGNNETQGLVPVSIIETNTDCTDLHGYLFKQKPGKPSLQYVSDLAVLYDTRHLFFLKNKLLDKKYPPFIFVSYRASHTS